MKRLFITLMLIPMFASCMLDDSDVQMVNAYKLGTYAKDRFVDVVALPVEALEVALLLDEYMSLEEKPKDSSLGYRYYKVADNIYRVEYTSSVEDRALYSQFNTNGRSIREHGATWTIDAFRITGNDFDYSSYDYTFDLHPGSELVFISAADSTWAMTMGDNVAMIKMHPKESEMFVWTVEAQGSENTEINVSSSFGTVSELAVKEVLLPSGEKTNSYKGQFNVDIFKDGEPHDYCYVTFDHDMESSYLTSR